ncbi:hypothetical protein [Mesorhizobium sp.]|uniref:hypothetical protein n=1 Tax=Mesorhizobium sp. TaxID=1871066 RepID=UPI0025E21FC1|nr:hypothetical protein [Mesorhizobium sp.]
MDNFIEQIREIRLQLGLSLVEAKRIVMKRHFLKRLDQAQHFDELKILVREIAEKVL